MNYFYNNENIKSVKNNNTNISYNNLASMYNNDVRNEQFTPKLNINAKPYKSKRQNNNNI